MTDDRPFEDRLRSTLDAEASALADRRAAPSRTAAVVPIAALVEEPEVGMPAGGRRFALSLVAAAVLLVGGIAGVVALGGSGGDTFVASRAGSQPLITATPTPVVEGEVAIYVVQAGDMLADVAAHFGLSVDVIRGANPGLDPRGLTVGDRIRIPGMSPPAGDAVDSDPTPAPGLTAPTAVRPPLPTVVMPSNPPPTPTPLSERLIITEPACVTRDLDWLEAGTCGIEVIGLIRGGTHVPVQVIDSAGRVNAGFVPVDALVSGEAEPRPMYQPGLLEDSWCVVDIFSPDTLNVRQGPFVDREILGELSEGQCAIFRTAGDKGSSFGGWVPIWVDQPEDTPLRGWVASAYLRPDSAYVASGIPMQTIRVRAEPIGPGLDVPTVDAFEFRDGATTLGRPDDAGAIEIPAAVEPVGLLASAPVEGDEFCAWTGRVEAADSAGFHVLEVAMLCA